MLGSAASDAQPEGYTAVVKGTDYAMYYRVYGEGTEMIRSSEEGGQKFMQDGKLYIRCGEKTYDALGNRVK